MDDESERLRRSAPQDSEGGCVGLPDDDLAAAPDSPAEQLESPRSGSVRVESLFPQPRSWRAVHPEVPAQRSGR
jgi:hypothetical protein